MNTKDIDPHDLAMRGPDLLKVEVPLQKNYNGTTDLLRAIPVGGSIVLKDMAIQNVSSLCSQLAKRHGWKFKCRSSDRKDSVSVWRVR